MSLLETVFTPQSHAFLKCQSFFVGELSSLPSCHLAAKHLFFFFFECVWFILFFQFFFGGGGDYFLLQFLLTSISLSGVFLSDLIINHFSRTGWNQTAGFVNSLPQLEASNCQCVYSDFLFGSMNLCKLHTKDRIFASQVVLLLRLQLLLLLLFDAKCCLSVSLCDSYCFTLKFVFRESHLEVVDSAVSYDCEEWWSGPRCP